MNTPEQILLTVCLYVMSVCICHIATDKVFDKRSRAISKFIMYIPILNMIWSTLILLYIFGYLLIAVYKWLMKAPKGFKEHFRKSYIEIKQAFSKDEY
jgi:hypothetical protein